MTYSVRSFDNLECATGRKQESAGMLMWQGQAIAMAKKLEAMFSKVYLQKKVSHTGSFNLGEPG